MLAGRLGLRRVVERAQHRIAVADRVLEIILVDLEVARDRLEHLEASGVEGREQLLERVLEARHFGGPKIVGHVVAEAMSRREVAADVPEFLEVVRLAALGGLDPERRVAPCSAAARDEVFALHILGQREEGLRFLLCLMDQRVGDAVVGDDREAIFLEALAELLGEGLRVAVGVLQRNGRNVVSSDRSHRLILAKELGQGSIIDASAALIKLARLPASSARIPSLAITGRWLGASPPVTAIWIAIELKLANPHSAKVTMARLRSDSSCAPILPRSIKATNPLSTSLVPNRPPAVPASLQ